MLITSGCGLRSITYGDRTKHQSPGEPKISNAPKRGWELNLEDLGV